MLLVPVIVSLTRSSGRPFLALALPLVAFLSLMHGLTPPHPGPVVAIDALGADNGKVLLLALVAGLPAAWLAGPVFARWAVRRFDVPAPAVTAGPLRPRPGFGVTLATIALPIGLMLLATLGELTLPKDAAARAALTLAGHPVTALAVSVVAALAVFGRSGGFTRAETLALTEQSVASIGMTLLVVAGGGGFARVLREAGVAGALGEAAGSLQLPVLVYAWLMAAFVRVATGSATVAITTAAGLVAPLAAADPTVDRELLVLAVGFGSLVLSHLNDGGFWIVKDFLGLTVGQTLRTWTVVETILATAGLGFVVLLSWIR
jgi:GntP family gluconate:H+ symporter